MFRRVGANDRERGQASTAYIGAILTVTVFIGSVSAAALTHQSDVTQAMKCAVLELVTAGHKTCDPAGGEGEPGAGPGGGGGRPGHRPRDCQDVIYADSASDQGQAADGYGRQVRVNCIWYPVPSSTRVRQGPWARPEGPTGSRR